MPAGKPQAAPTFASSGPLNGIAGPQPGAPLSSRLANSIAHREPPPSDVVSAAMPESGATIERETLSRPAFTPTSPWITLNEEPRRPSTAKRLYVDRFRLGSPTASTRPGAARNASSVAVR